MVNGTKSHAMGRCLVCAWITAGNDILFAIHFLAPSSVSATSIAFITLSGDYRPQVVPDCFYHLIRVFSELLLISSLQTVIHPLALTFGVFRFLRKDIVFHSVETDIFV